MFSHVPQALLAVLALFHARSAGASPLIVEDPVPNEFTFLAELQEALSAFLVSTGGDGSEATVRRHLEDDQSIGTRALEGALTSLLQKYGGSPQGQEQDHRALENPLVGCIVETLACRLYLDNLYMPQVENYRFNDVSLDKNCAKITKVPEIKFTKSAGAIKPNEFRYQSVGPASLRGVFSLNYSPCKWSSLVSFAESEATSPGGISTGELGNVGIENFVDTLSDLISGAGSPLELDAGAVVGPLRAPSDYAYAMRVLGDANWAFGECFYGCIMLARPAASCC